MRTMGWNTATASESRRAPARVAGRRRPKAALRAGAFAVALALIVAACAEAEEPVAEPEAEPTDEAPADEVDAPEGEPIRVGAIFDETGPINIYGEHKVNVTQLAIEALNEQGGVLDRPLELVMYDAQSSNELYTQYANQLILEDEVEVIMAGITSASREAIRPVINRHDMLYFYNEQYEGGVCDRNVFSTGVVPSQQLAALIPYGVETFGPEMYVLAADYNYGWISAAWVEEFAAEAGGEVVTDAEFFPLDVGEFGPAISAVQAADPDFIVSLLVGGDHISFYREWTAAGLQDQYPIVSPTYGLGNEQVILGEDGEGIVTAFPYYQELDTPENEEFVARWHERFGADYPYIPDQAVDEWLGWHLWAMAVEQAGTTEKDAVIEALESGLSFDGPGGTVVLDPPTHHLVKDVHIGIGDGDGGFEIVESFEQVPPAFEQEVCDLIANPDTSTQFEPIETD